jgi:hypothetical protein
MVSEQRKRFGRPPLSVTVRSSHIVRRQHGHLVSEIFGD